MINNSNGIFRQVALLRLEGGHQMQNSAREDLDRVVTARKERIGTAYTEAMREVEENRGARETKSTWMLLGTIIGGIGIGSGIGQGIGEGASDGDRAEARAAHTNTVTADLDVKSLGDRFDDARERLDDSTHNTESAAKFGRELREAGWVGIAD